MHKLLLTIVICSILSVGCAPIAAIIATPTLDIPTTTPTPAPVVRYVKPNGESSGSCNTWPSSCTLQYALSIAVPGEQLWVVKGTYTPTTGSDRTLSFDLKDGVAIYGGFNGLETGLTQRKPTVNVTILSGDLGAARDANDNSYHVVTANSVTSAAVLDGFTITGGNANGPNDRGGGMLVGNASPTLRNLVFSANAATTGGGLYNDYASPTLSTVTFSYNTAQYGGGMANFNNSNPTLTDAVFTGNSASGTNSQCEGGGMYNNGSSPALANVSFYGNSGVPYGGGMCNAFRSSPTLSRVVFQGNTASIGGGMMNVIGGNPVLMNVSFLGNIAAAYGGGMNNGQSNPTLKAVTFSGNRVTQPGGQGGGMHNSYSSPSLSNVTFEGNIAAEGGAGGGMLNSYSSPSLNNVTFSHNKADAGGNMYNFRSGGSIVNSVLWDGVVTNDASTTTITNSIMPWHCPSSYACVYVTDADPLLGPLQDNGGFVQTMALRPGSAAIDAGGKYGNCEPADARGVARPQGAACDLGAYEVGP